MTNHLALLILWGIVAVGFTIFLWIYWSLALPIIRRELFFKTENALDAFRILGLSGEIPPGSRLYAQISSFLQEAREATSKEGWISIIRVSDTEIKDRSIRLRALLAEMDNAHPDIRHIVAETMFSLTSLYIAQRPFVVCVMLPLQAMAYFVQRSRNFLIFKEVEFAASSLATAGMVPTC